MTIDHAACVQKKGAELLGTLWQQRGWSVAAVNEVVVTDFSSTRMIFVAHYYETQKFVCSQTRFKNKNPHKWQKLFLRDS